ncbi:MAG: hypothetical protein RSC01_02530 [Oscillospiraceae bacterium]
MNFLLKVTINVIKRRILSGEMLENVLTDYPKLTPTDISTITTEITKEKTL